jgi:predicted lipoprotein
MNTTARRIMPKAFVPITRERIMGSYQGCRALFGAVLLFTVVPAPLVASASDKNAAKQGGKVAGILIDKKADWITVKADGEDKAVKYLIGDKPDKKRTAALKTIFDASRVQLTYKQAGDSRQLVSIKKQVLKASGTVTGVVVKVYNEFWVEVKPKKGPSDAYAPGANYTDKAFMEKLKGLKAGDSVTIKFYTDFERHRILTLRKN